MNRELISVLRLETSRGLSRRKREKAEIGVFITLEEPSSEMKLEATTAASTANKKAADCLLAERRGALWRIAMRTVA